MDRTLHICVSEDTYMRDPLEYPPPKATKLILATKGGILTVGEWGDDCIAWSPLLKIPQSVKDRLRAERRELLWKASEEVSEPSSAQHREFPDVVADDYTDIILMATDTVSDGGLFF